MRPSRARAGRPPRVLHVIDSLILGGAESLLTALVVELDRCGLSRNAVCAFTPEVADASLITRFRMHGAQLTLVPASRVYDPRLLGGVLGAAWRHRAELIHSHLSAATIAARAVGLILRIPVVTTVHTIPGPTAEDNTPRQAAERLTTRLSAAIVAPSPEVAAGYAARRRRRASALRVIPNAPAAAMPGGDFDRDSYRRELVGDGRGPVILCVARLQPEKAIDDLIRAVATLRQRHRQIVLLIAGDGPEKEKLRGLAAQLEVEDAVRILGRRDDVGSLLSSADVFCLPSRYEGLPVSILEALAAHTPVVATRVGGIPGLLTDDTTAVLVPPGDPSALAAGLERLLDDEALRRRITVAGHALVEQRYSITAVARQYAELYGRLIHAREGQRAMTPSAA